MREFIIDNKPCPYLQGLTAKTRYILETNATTDQCQEYIEHGWRRFGKLFFTPICEGCQACLSMRINVKDFKPSRSHKRTIKANQKTKTVIARPSVSHEHLKLYDRYHADMKGRRGWENDSISAEEYFSSFVDGYNQFGYEFRYEVDEKLIGVALVDILHDGLSAIYCYYDPDYRHLSLGTYSILKQIEIANRINLDYIYLGYWVEDNASLTYKSRYHPHEILTGGFSRKESAIWSPVKKA